MCTFYVWKSRCINSCSRSSTFKRLFIFRAVWDDFCLMIILFTGSWGVQDFAETSTEANCAKWRPWMVHRIRFQISCQWGSYKTRQEGVLQARSRLQLQEAWKVPISSHYPVIIEQTQRGRWSWFVQYVRSVYPDTTESSHLYHLFWIQVLQIGDACCGSFCMGGYWQQSLGMYP